MRESGTRCLLSIRGCANNCAGKYDNIFAGKYENIFAGKYDDDPIMINTDLKFVKKFTRFLFQKFYTLEMCTSGLILSTLKYNKFQYEPLIEMKM